MADLKSTKRLCARFTRCISTTFNARIETRQAVNIALLYNSEIIGHTIEHLLDEVGMVHVVVSLIDMTKIQQASCDSRWF